MIKKKIGQNIAEIRNLRRMSQQDLAKKLGKSRAVISHYERGHSDIPFSIVEKIASVFKVPTERLLIGADYKSILDEAKGSALKKFNPKESPSVDARLEIIERKIDTIIDKLGSIN